MTHADFISLLDGSGLPDAEISRRLGLPAAYINRMRRGEVSFRPVYYWAVRGALHAGDAVIVYPTIEDVRQDMPGVTRLRPALGINGMFVANIRAVCIETGEYLKSGDGGGLWHRVGREPGGWMLETLRFRQSGRSVEGRQEEAYFTAPPSRYVARIYGIDDETACAVLACHE